MKTIFLLVCWLIMIFLLWIFSVLFVVNHNVNDSNLIRARNERYLKIIKSFFYFIAVLFSLLIGYLL